jgi:hypothetical protein
MELVIGWERTSRSFCQAMALTIQLMALQVLSTRIGLAATIMITMKPPPSVGAASGGFLLGREGLAILGVAASEAGRDGREGVEVPWTRYVHIHLLGAHGGEMREVDLSVCRKQSRRALRWHAGRKHGRAPSVGSRPLEVVTCPVVARNGLALTQEVLQVRAQVVRVLSEVHFDLPTGGWAGKFWNFWEVWGNTGSPGILPGHLGFFPAKAVSRRGVDGDHGWREVGHRGALRC